MTVYKMIYSERKLQVVNPVKDDRKVLYTTFKININKKIYQKQGDE